VHGFKAAVQWRDSGKPIPQGEEARAMIAQLERQLRQQSGPQGGVQVKPKSTKANDKTKAKPKRVAKAKAQ
jgi:hypothetical protein